MEDKCYNMGPNRADEVRVVEADGSITYDYTHTRCMCEPVKRTSHWQEGQCMGAVFVCRNRHGHFFFGSWCARRRRWLNNSELRAHFRNLRVPEERVEEYKERYC